MGIGGAVSSGRRARARRLGARSVATVVTVLAAALVVMDASPGSAKASASKAPAIVTVAGSGAQSGALAAGVPSTTVALGSPVGVAADSHDNVLIADQNNNVIRVAAAATGTFYGVGMTAGRIYTIVGTGAAGNGPWGTLPPTGPLQVALNDPNGVAVDAQGDVAITDTGNNAVRLLAGATGARFGQLMTAGQIYTIAASDGSVYPAEAASEAALSSPDGVTFDAHGDIVIADTGNDIVRFLPQGSGTFFGRAMQAGYIYTIAGVPGAYGYTGNGGPGGSAQISIEPFAGVAVDAAGDVAFADADNEVIRLVADASHTFEGRPLIAGDVYTIAGNGNEAYSGNKKAALSASLDTPQGVAFDAAGNLLVSDSNNNVIRIVPAANGKYGGKTVKAGRIYTIAGIPTANAGYTGNGGPATSAELNAPAGLGVLPSGLPLIADNGNNVVRELTSPATARRAPTASTVTPATGPGRHPHRAHRHPTG
jgi:hypothetical protein